MAAPAAHAYTFGTPAVGAIGPETTTFDWSADRVQRQRHPGSAVACIPRRVRQGRPDQLALHRAPEGGEHAGHGHPGLQPDRHGLRQQCRSLPLRRQGVGGLALHHRRRDDRICPDPCRVPGLQPLPGVLHPVRRVVHGQAEVLVQRAHAREVHQRRRHVLACRPAGPLRRRPALSVLAGTGRSASSSRATSCAARTASTTCSCTWRTTACSPTEPACGGLPTSPTHSPGGHGTAQASTSGSATPTGIPTTRPKGSAPRCRGTGSAPSRRA